MLHSYQRQSCNDHCKCSKKLKNSNLFLNMSIQYNHIKNNTIFNFIPFTSANNFWQSLDQNEIQLSIPLDVMKSESLHIPTTFSSRSLSKISFEIPDIFTLFFQSYSVLQIRVFRMAGDVFL